MKWNEMKWQEMNFDDTNETAIAEACSGIDTAVQFHFFGGIGMFQVQAP